MQCINMYGLLTKCEVKMAGYWPSSFLRVYGPRRRTRPISSHLDRTNFVNKGFIIWLLVKFCLRDRAGSPERARWSHLARSGSQSQCAIWSILPTRGASRIISRCHCTFLNFNNYFKIYFDRIFMLVLAPFYHMEHHFMDTQSPSMYLVIYPNKKSLFRFIDYFCIYKTSCYIIVNMLAT